MNWVIFDEQNLPHHHRHNRRIFTIGHSRTYTQRQTYFHKQPILKKKKKSKTHQKNTKIFGKKKQQKTRKFKSFCGNSLFSQKRNLKDNGKAF